MSLTDRPPRLVFGAALGASFVAVVAAVFAFSSPPREPVQVHLAPDIAPTPAELKTYVSGAVRFPGVYQLAGGQRVEDALYAAGGPSDDADLERLNLAERLKDGSHVQVPRRGEQPPLGTSGGPRLNLNTAAKAELDRLLPNIGKVRAQRIVASRSNDGPYKDPFDLVTRGIVPLSVFQQIKDLVHTP